MFWTVIYGLLEAVICLSSIFLGFIISTENIGILLMGLHFYVTWCFSLAAFNIHDCSVHLVFWLFCIIGFSFFVLYICLSECPLYLDGHLFLLNWRLFFCDFVKSIPCAFGLCFFCIPVSYRVGPFVYFLDVKFPQSFLCLIFFWLCISSTLSSRSKILSSMSFTLWVRLISKVYFDILCFISSFISVCVFFFHALNYMHCFSSTVFSQSLSFIHILF